MIILGIETSCDETALALIETHPATNSSPLTYRIIQSLVHSQAKLHSAYGGVFPTLAKREHSKNLVPLLEKILKDLPTHEPKVHTSFTETLSEFKIRYGTQNSELIESFTNAPFLAHIPPIDRIAVTEGPGLEPALWVGITFAQMLGELWNIPVIPVNHMEGHVIGSLISDDKPYGSWQTLKVLPTPAVALLISGGHTELVNVEHQNQDTPSYSYTLLGQTVDDAVGEAFDKVARILGLLYPGGPHISRLANEAREQHIESPVKLPRPMISSDNMNFSFSGLKTAVLYAYQKAEKEGKLNDPHIALTFKKGLAYEFEVSVSDVLEAKLKKALQETGAQALIIGGGVSANHLLRTRFQQIADTYDIPLLLPSLHISGDNALMIAIVGALSPIQSTKLHAQGTKKLAA